MEQNQIITFLDSTGRIIYGKFAGETETHLKVADPAQIYVQPTQSGQLNVQSIPLFFREFAKNTDPVVWLFLKSAITLNENLQLDERLIQQYNNLLVKPVLQPQSAPSGEPKVIKLFED